LQEQAFSSPDSFFHRFASLSREDAVRTATEVWHAINEPNLVENVLPTRSRATLVLKKGPNHKVSSVLLRKI
jgi:type I pantothenate kinase